MKVEFEATFIDIDVDEVRNILKSLKAKLIKPETLMRRVTFFPPHNDEHGWMRVRDEGDKITLSYKRFLGQKKAKTDIKMSDQQEICLRIDNFDEGVNLLKSLGAKQKSYQETKREEWHYENLEITIDTWPGLEPFVEVEGQNETEVKKFAKKMGFDYSQAIYGPVTLIYEKKLGIPQDIINNHTPLITFEKPPKSHIT
jgi:adenylate cyclase, class 2